MAEGAYEAGTEYGFDVTPLWVRRQAYYSYLAGAHHTYGHNDSWRVLPSWKSALDSPGAQQMGILRKLFEARAEWWLLAPDQSVLADRRPDRGPDSSPGGAAPGRQVGHDLPRRQGRVQRGPEQAERQPKSRGFWCNPQSGEETPIEPLTNKGVKAFSTPEGWEDALLILETKEERR